MLETIYEALRNGSAMVFYYLSSHTLTCLVPAFFIAGAITAFIKKEAIIKYLGPDVKKRISYPLASVSGAILAVCSCTILPIFAGLYKKGSGVGPATAFLYSGPAINILAIVYTASELGYQIGLARVLASVGMAFIIAFLMSSIFRADDEEISHQNSGDIHEKENSERPSLIKSVFFGSLVAILIIGASGSIAWIPKLIIISTLTLLLLTVIKYYYKKREVKDWGLETWYLTKMIFPILIVGTFIVGIIEFYIPAETFRPYLGTSSLSSSFLGSIVGALLYMPTLLEVPIVGTTFGYQEGVMGEAPALSLLLAGPSLSLPNMVVLFKVMKLKHWLVYICFVIIFSTSMGFVYGIVV